MRRLEPITEVYGLTHRLKCTTDTSHSEWYVSLTVSPETPTV